MHGGDSRIFVVLSILALILIPTGIFLSLNVEVDQCKYYKPITNENITYYTPMTFLQPYPAKFPVCQVNYFGFDIMDLITIADLACNF